MAVPAFLRFFTVAAFTLVVGCGGPPSEQTPDNPGGAIVSTAEDDSRYRGAEPPTPYRMPNVTLTATNSADFNLVTDTGYPVTLVFYAYVHCPDVCPLVLSDLTAAVRHLPGDVRMRTQVVVITTDPARDGPEELREYLDRYDEDFVGLTGELDDIVRAASAMGVAIEGTHRLPSGGYDVGHSTQVIGFRGNSAPVLWTEGTPVDDMVADITALAAS